MKPSLFALLFVIASTAILSAVSCPLPPDVWKDYDPNQGEFREEIIKQETSGGVFYRESYISAYILGEEVRVFCKYSVKQGATKAPGLLAVHGFMGMPAIPKSYVDEGWAVMAHDYCGKVAGRTHFTRYPERFHHGNMDKDAGPQIHDSLATGKPITDVKQSSDYLWVAIERRVLSYLEQQKEVDRTRMGATGYSYGGTIMWALGTDPRVKAVVAYFGIGWNEYYRNKAVWMYNNPYVEPPKTSGEELFLAGMSPEAYVPYMMAATLWLNGSSDHHGGFERGIESFMKFKPGVPWSYAVQARGHHNVEKIEQDTKMWLEKHVLNKDVFWPAQPKSFIRLDAEGVPELVITPASSERVRKVETWYALKTPAPHERSWRDATCVKSGDSWIAKLPVLNVDDYVFGYGNVTYDTTVVVSSPFNAVIPSRLGNAKATDHPGTTGRDALSAWTNSAEAEGPGGIKGIRGIDNNKGTGSEQFMDPKFAAPKGSDLRLKFYCTEPQSFVISANDQYQGSLSIPASDEWQEMIVPASRLLNKGNEPMRDWSGIRKIGFKAAKGSEIFKVIFAEFTWLPARTNP